MSASEDQIWRIAQLTTMSPDDLAELLYDDPAKAAPWLEACAAAGLPEAQVRLGRMLLAGEGVAKDQAAALKCFEAAADAGDIDALNMMGRCLEMGWGVAIDLERAAHCYAEAAEAGHAWAQYNFGHLWLNGQGVKRDPRAAFDWYMRAAAQGHARAMNLVGRCFEEAWGVARNADAALLWYGRSAAGGSFRGCYNFASALAQSGCALGADYWFKRALATAPEPTRALMRARPPTHHPAMLSNAASTVSGRLNTAAKVSAG